MYGLYITGLSAPSSSSFRVPVVHLCTSLVTPQPFLLLSLQLSIKGPLQHDRRNPPISIFKHFCFQQEQKLFYTLNSCYLHPSSKSAAVFSFSSPSIFLVGLHLPCPMFLSGWLVPLHLLLIVAPVCLLGFLKGFQEI